MRASFVMSGVATGLRRNLLMSVALILTTAISIGFLGAALLTNHYIDKFNAHYESKLSVQIYLCTKPVVADPPPPCTARYTDAQQKELTAQLKADPRVTSFSFINEDQALQVAKQILPSDATQGATTGTFPASFVLKLKDISRDFDAVQSTYANKPGVQLVQNEDEGLKVILKLFDGARLFSIVVAIVILICAAILVAMTIQVAAAQRRIETSIMRLVGASRWMTQLPFIIESVIATVIGGILALVLDGLGVWFLLGHLLKTQVNNHVLPDLSANDVLLWGGAGALAGIILAALTAFVTLRLYVRL
jgi:cell division transport system permease protein